jgi:L-seryl-tRNA(Ser) seleniumtransferase
LPDPQYRSLPSADGVLRSEVVAALLQRWQRAPILWLVRQVLQDLRSEITGGSAPPSLDSVADLVVARAELMWLRSPRETLNATGVLLHTNLGRAPLSDEALAAIMEVGRYSDLEFDLASATRTSRQTHVGFLLRALTGAEASYVAVNAAAAMLLTLTALTRGKEVVVSRGQAVEIGGGFRIPAILRQSAAKLVEVGTTNRTRLADYEGAISPRTAAILHVHTSNFRIIGFTETVAIEDLAQLARAHKILLIDDNGSGALLDTAQFGLSHEPMPAESLAAGADVVAFSGDKLLGGPQAGILLGRAPTLERIAGHPLARTVRPDKSILAALSATLLAYVRGDAVRTLPLWHMMAQSADELHGRAIALQARALSYGIRLDITDGESTIGGGSLPGETLPTTLLVLPKHLHAQDLRLGEPAIIGRTRGARVLLDLRTIPSADDVRLLAGLVAASSSVRPTETKVVDS